MGNQQAGLGNWDQLKARIKQKWGQLKDADLDSGQGNRDQLIERIQKRTGEARDQVVAFLDECATSCEGKLEQTLEEAVEQRPGQTMLAAFSCGLLTGVGLTLLMRESKPQSVWKQGKDTADHLSRQIVDAIAALPESLASRLRS